jgi:hypothetical protein
MPRIPEPINHYLSKFLGVRLITKSDFDLISKTLHDAMAELDIRDAQNIFTYLPKNREIEERVRTVLKFIRPKHVQNASKMRIGNTGDGGYVCLDYFSDIKSAVSLGISDDVSWDADVADRGIKVFQYDYTVDGPPIQHDNFKFFKLKVASEDGPGSIKLDTIFKTNHITDPKSVLLKMDIEGYEWESFLSASDETLDACAEIVCEFHNFDRLADDAFFEQVKNCFEKLSRKFEIFHVHGNNCTPLLISPGVGTLPQTLEISFANKSIFSFSDGSDEFPTSQDAPCHLKKADYFIDAI